MNYLMALLPVAGQSLLVIGVLTWLAWDAKRRMLQGTPAAVALSVATGSAALIMGMGWFLAHYVPMRPEFEESFSGQQWTQLVQDYADETVLVGRLIYALAFVLGLVAAAAIPAAISGASHRWTLAAIFGLALSFLVSPGFVWLEFTASCQLGHAIVLHGATLC